MKNNDEKIISTIGVLAFKDGKVLLVRHGEKAEHLSGVYGLPAGRVGNKEKEIDTAVRELYEETGLKVSPENLQELPNIYTARIQRKNEIKTFSLKVFVARFYSGKLRITKETDEAVPEWVKISDFKKYSLLPNVKRVIKDGLKIMDNPVGHHRNIKNVMGNKIKLILGSSSKPRQEILQNLGYKFDIVKPEIDERMIRYEDPKELVLKIAHAKADDIIEKISGDAIIIVGDSVTVVNGEIREKAQDKEQAYQWIQEISDGVPQTQISSVVIANTKTGERFEGVGEASVIFNPVPEADIKEFVESGTAFNHAGAYAIQDPIFKRHIRVIKGELEIIMGLPKKLTEDLLKNCDIECRKNIKSVVGDNL